MGWIVAVPFYILLFLIIIFLFVLMPRVFHKPDMTVFRIWDYAHRGYHDERAKIPENSLAAFQRAVDCGYGAELDVHLTKDGELAVIHDESLKRMCGVEVNVCDLTMEELKQYRLQGTEESIPALQEVLDIFAGKTPLIVEIKTCGGNVNMLCAKVAAVLDKYKGAACIESFDPRAVFWFRRKRPDTVRGHLITKYTGQKTPHPVLGFLQENLLTNFLTVPDFIAMDIKHREMHAFQLCRLIYNVMEVSWTVRSPEQAQLIKDARGLIIFEAFDPKKELNEDVLETQPDPLDHSGNQE